MLVDTDVLIRALRGNLKAARALDGATERAVSVVSYMELIQGARDRQESRAIKAFPQAAEFQVRRRNPCSR
jgi:predicted nucleic acid-binding protein